MGRKLFCELNPITYKVSVLKGIMTRRIKWIINSKSFARHFSKEPLPFSIYKHKSLIRRSLGNVDMKLQENKAVNLNIAIPNVNGILIKPGEVFSFWRLVGKCTAKKGYLDGLFIKSGEVNHGTGGGMCQFTNLIHWLILHSPLTITEQHHHNKIDMFPDDNRKIPFGTGTSIMYNYIDYQFINNTKYTFQLRINTDSEYLYGELLCDRELDVAYHVYQKEHYFTREGNDYYRNNEVYREITDKKSGKRISNDLIIKNHSRVLYDSRFISKDLIR